MESLISLGADKNVVWDTLDGTEDGWDLSFLPDRVFTDFQNYCVNLGSPNVAMDAYEHSGLSLLHLAVSHCLSLLQDPSTSMILCKTSFVRILSITLQPYK